MIPAETLEDGNVTNARRREDTGNQGESSTTNRDGTRIGTHERTETAAGEGAMTVATTADTCNEVRRHRNTTAAGGRATTTATAATAAIVGTRAAAGNGAENGAGNGRRGAGVETAEDGPARPARPPPPTPAPSHPGQHTHTHTSISAPHQAEPSPERASQ